MVYVALFAALTAVLSQISIPMPAGIPLTLQTFAIAFAGFYLGFGKGLQCVFVYVLLGVCGVPVIGAAVPGVASLISDGTPAYTISPPQSPASGPKSIR